MAQPPGFLTIKTQCEQGGLVQNYSWPQTLFVPLALITTVVLASLAIQGHLSATTYGITALSLATVTIILTMGNRTNPDGLKVTRLFSYALIAVLTSLMIAGIIPQKPIAALLLSFALVEMACCCPCTICAPSMKAAEEDAPRQQAMASFANVGRLLAQEQR